MHKTVTSSNILNKCFVQYFTLEDLFVKFYSQSLHIKGWKFNWTLNTTREERSDEDLQVWLSNTGMGKTNNIKISICCFPREKEKKQTLIELESCVWWCISILKIRFVLPVCYMSGFPHSFHLNMLFSFIWKNMINQINPSLDTNYLVTQNRKNMKFM